MIVIAPTLSIVEPYQFTLNHPVIGYQTVVNVSNVTSSSEDPDYPVTNLANPATHLKWRALETTAPDVEWVDVELAAVQFFDYVGIARHNLGSAQIPVTILGADEVDSNGDPIFDIELVPEQLLPDDRPALFRFTLQNLIAVRIYFGVGTDFPEIAVCFVGELLTLQRKIYVGHTPIVYGRNRRIVTGRSESGQYLGRVIISESRETAVSLQNLTPDWYRTYLDPFVEACDAQPFFFAWRPQTYPTEVGFAWMTNEPQPQNQLPNGMMSIDFQMSGID